MLSEGQDRLIPEIKPRAEPDIPGKDNGKFHKQTNRENIHAGGSERSFESKENVRSGRKQRPPRFRTADAPEASHRFTQVEDNGITTNGMSHRRQRRRFAEMAAGNYLHSFKQAADNSSYTDRYEDSNAGVEAAEDSVMLTGESLIDLSERTTNRMRMRRQQMLMAGRPETGTFFDGAEMSETAASDPNRKNRIRRYYQKQRYKRMYAERRFVESGGQEMHMSRIRLSARIKASLRQAFDTKKRALLVLGIVLLMVLLLMASVSSCAASIHGLTSSIMATTYPSEDEDIYAVEEVYAAMEAKLNAQIYRMEVTHPGYDEYLYQVDEIAHNPYHLISYFTVKYGQFTYEQVKSELSEIFHQQYSISTSTSTQEITETVTEVVDGEEVEKEETKTVTSFNITMTNHDLDSVLKARMSSDERVQYELYNTTHGNRDYLFDLSKLTTYSPRGLGITYQIPPEALTDERFRRMIREAEKYLGYPYVWGGSSPSESFDCSGFVSWVVNHCGNGWNVGRLGATGLMQHCAIISPANAKPGDLIFFQNTYPTSGASHVGIYVGNGMMIHCGNPIQYTSIKSAYWQQHFLCFGRMRG